MAMSLFGRHSAAWAVMRRLACLEGGDHLVERLAVLVRERGQASASRSQRAAASPSAPSELMAAFHDQRENILSKLWKARSRVSL